MNNLRQVKHVLPPLVDAQGNMIKGETVVDGVINLEEVLDYFDLTDGYDDMDEFVGQPITRITYTNLVIRDLLMPIGEFNRIMLDYQNSKSKWIVKSKLN